MRKKSRFKTYDVICPICNLQLTGYSRTLGLHAKQHNLSSEEFYVMLFCNNIRPKCSCKNNCESYTSWSGWNDGFGKLAYRHTTNEIIQKIVKSRLQTIQSPDWKHWSTKEQNVEIVKKASQKRSVTMKNKIETGEVVMWMSTDKSEEIRKSISQTRKKNYCAKKHPLRMSYDVFIKRLNLVIQDKFEIVSGVDLFDDRHNNIDHQITLKCKTCAYEHKSSVYNLIRYDDNQLRCKNCGFDSTPSRSQIEIFNYVKSLNVPVLLNNRTLISPLEIDVLVPDQLAIEFDGLYWHSELFSSKNDKENKRKNCLQQQVQFLSFFEDEWENKIDICKSMILHRLKKSVKIGARKCNIVVLDNDEKKEFFSNNHLDGDAESIISFGLTYKNEIVAAVSLRKSFSEHGNLIEIARFATKQFICVTGGLSKLMTFVKMWAKMHEYTQIITCVDARIGSGLSYMKIGFKQLDDTDVKFWLTDKNQRFSHQQITQQNEITERKMYKIYGCVKHKFIIDV